MVSWYPARDVRGFESSILPVLSFSSEGEVLPPQVRIVHEAPLTSHQEASAKREEPRRTSFRPEAGGSSRLHFHPRAPPLSRRRQAMSRCGDVRFYSRASSSMINFESRRKGQEFNPVSSSHALIDSSTSAIDLQLK